MPLQHSATVQRATHQVTTFLDVSAERSAFVTRLDDKLLYAPYHSSPRRHFVALRVCSLLFTSRLHSVSLVVHANTQR